MTATWVASRFLLLSPVAYCALYSADQRAEDRTQDGPARRGGLPSGGSRRERQKGATHLFDNLKYKLLFHLLGDWDGESFFLCLCERGGILARRC